MISDTNYVSESTAGNERKKSEAAIKSQFLKPLPLSGTDTTRQKRDTEEQGEEPAKKQKRGQNKSRTATRSYDSIRICNELDKCTRGPDCKFSHDISAYYEAKEADIGEKCHLFETFGFCKYGVKCRWASSHIDENLVNVVNQEKFDSTDQNTVLNVVTREFQKTIRSKKALAPRTEEFAAKWQQAKKESRKQEESTSEEVKADDENETSLHSEKLAKIENTSHDVIKLTVREKKKLDFRGKTYLAPLTTVGNLPFRRICKEFGVDITCGEMAVDSNLLNGQQTEWALMRRHKSEDLFGVQIAGSSPYLVTKTAELINSQCQVDFVDLNCGCPIDAIYRIGAGSALLDRNAKTMEMVQGMNYVLDCPVTVKIRTGVHDNKPTALKTLSRLKSIGINMVTMHGRSRQQRYTKLADWDYIGKCAEEMIDDEFQLFGNGDVLSHAEYYEKLEKSGVSGIMIGRGALVKPWIFTEIKEKRIWDISSRERFDMLKNFANYGLEHWGSDTMGVNHTRRFMCEAMSFLHRYIPVGLLEVLPQKMNDRPPPFYGRDELETLMASPLADDWVKLTERILGPAPQDFKFIPK